MAEAVEFERFLVANEGRLRAYVAAIGVGRDAVDEVAQEAFVAFWLQGDRRPDDAEAWPWLKGIARHKALHHLRARSARRARLVELLGAPADAGAEIDDDDEALSALRGCLAQLGEQGRRLVELHYARGCSSERIAELVALTGSAVRKQLLRLREALAGCVRARIGRGGT